MNEYETFLIPRVSVPNFELQSSHTGYIYTMLPRMLLSIKGVAVLDLAKVF